MRSWQLYKCFSALIAFCDINFVKGNLGFAEASTSEEWIIRGDKFMAKSLFNAAATCFREGGNHYKENIAKCHQKALEASRFVKNKNFTIKVSLFLQFY